MDKDQILLEQAYDRVLNGGMQQYKRLSVNNDFSFSMEVKNTTSNDIKSILYQDRIQALKELSPEDLEFERSTGFEFIDGVSIGEHCGGYTFGEETAIYIILPTHPLYKEFQTSIGEEDEAIQQINDELSDGWHDDKPQI